MADEYFTVQVPPMTGSNGSSPLPLWMFPLPDRYPGNLEGRILLRGGAGIRLAKCPDRFTVQLTHPVENLAQWANRLGCELAQELPAIEQIALNVKAVQLEAVMARARSLPEVAFASHAYFVSDPEFSPFEREPSDPEPSDLNSPQPIVYLTNQLALQFQPQTSTQQIEAMIRAVGLEVLKRIPGIPKAFVYQLTPKAIANPLKLANRLVQHPDLLLAEPNVAISTTISTAISTVGPDAGSPLEDQPPGAGWNLPRGNPTAADRSTVVAVVDEAIDLSHPAFTGVGKIVAPLDLTAPQYLTAPQSEPSEQVQTELSGATLCAQAAIGEALPSDAPQAATVLFSGGGIAAGCSLMPITLGSLLEDSVIERVFDWGMSQGAAVFCWKRSGSLPPSLRQRAAVHRAATQGRSGRGCVVLTEGGSGWKGLPDIVAVAIDAAEAKFAALRMGIETGIAAKVLSVNPDLTAERVGQILQTVHGQRGHSIALFSSDIATPVNLAVNLAINLAASDAAVLRTRSRIDKTALQPLELTDRTPREIPDGEAPGILASVEVQQAGTIGEIEVSLAIDHFFMGDLKIWLIPPRGEAVLLQDRTLGSLPSLSTTYGLNTTPHLRSLLGRSAQGTWTLQICDAVPGHRGWLKEWQLRLGVQQADKVP